MLCRQQSSRARGYGCPEVSEISNTGSCRHNAGTPRPDLVARAQGTDRGLSPSHLWIRLFVTERAAATTTMSFGSTFTDSYPDLLRGLSDSGSTSLRAPSKSSRTTKRRSRLASRCERKIASSSKPGSTRRLTRSERKLVTTATAATTPKCLDLEPRSLPSRTRMTSSRDLARPQNLTPNLSTTRTTS